MHTRRRSIPTRGDWGMAVRDPGTPRRCRSRGDPRTDGNRRGGSVEAGVIRPVGQHLATRQVVDTGFGDLVCRVHRFEPGHPGVDTGSTDRRVRGLGWVVDDVGDHRVRIRGDGGWVRVERVEGGRRGTTRPHVAVRHMPAADGGGAHRQRIGDHRDQVVDIGTAHVRQMRVGDRAGGIGGIAGGGIGITHQRHHEVEQRVCHVMPSPLPPIVTAEYQLMPRMLSAEHLSVIGAEPTPP